VFFKGFSLVRGVKLCSCVGLRGAQANSRTCKEAGSTFVTVWSWRDCPLLIFAMGAQRDLAVLENLACAFNGFLRRCDSTYWCAFGFAGLRKAINHFFSR
jgi:hypothetical protein